MARAVFDASAVLAHLNREPGSEKLTAIFGSAVISTVNLAEVVTKLVEWNVSLDLIREALSRYGFEIVDFNADLAERSALLRPKTKSLGLSLGDRACLALALSSGLPVWTADRAWRNLDLPVEIRLLREDS